MSDLSGGFFGRGRSRRDFIAMDLPIATPIIGLFITVQRPHLARKPSHQVGRCQSRQPPSATPAARPGRGAARRRPRRTITDFHRTSNTSPRPSAPCASLTARAAFTVPIQKASHPEPNAANNSPSRGETGPPPRPAPGATTPQPRMSHLHSVHTPGPASPSNNSPSGCTEPHLAPVRFHGRTGTVVSSVPNRR